MSWGQNRLNVGKETRNGVAAVLCLQNVVKK
nr:MAG TPA: hypothetical protein [Caudoviricetes sp.]